MILLLYSVYTVYPFVSYVSKRVVSEPRKFNPGEYFSLSREISYDEDGLIVFDFKFVDCACLVFKFQAI